MSIDKKKIGRIIKVSAVILGVAFMGLSIIAKKKKASSVYDDEPEEKNPLAGKKVVFIEDGDDKEIADGVKGHLEAVGDNDRHPSFYDKYVKRVLDIVLSFGGLVVFSPVYLAIAIAIKIEDPGPVLFTQKRVGRNKEYFRLHKFRSMKMSTPHDVPTHMLDDPGQYITRVGKFLRTHSLDELPQIWDIFMGNMSVVGPRPALWNQDLLTAERDKYGANDIKPGLTGWAQINGRDELEIPAKAKLDGEYVRKMGLWMDLKCFLGTIGSVLSSEGVVEGGTGEIHKKGEQTGDGNKTSEIQKEDEDGSRVCTTIKKILITGADSYIGELVKFWLLKTPGKYEVKTLDIIGDSWRDHDFFGYDIVYHVAGIAHADVGRVTEEQKQLYYEVNTDLAVKVAKKAKEAGVKQFIFMSSMIVYSGCKEKMITADTEPKPLNFYGDSKWQADQKIRALADENFKVVVLRPPMVYGKGSKGNYPKLAKLAVKLPVFPIVNNQRSMIHIDNLCQFVKLMIDNEESGIFFPQNGEYTNISDMVQMIAKVKGHRIIMLPFTDFVVKMLEKVPGKIGGLATKAFGDSVYDMEMSEYKEDYRVVSLTESIIATER